MKRLRDAVSSQDESPLSPPMSGGEGDRVSTKRSADFDDSIRKRQKVITEVDLELHKHEAEVFKLQPASNGLKDKKKMKRDKKKEEDTQYKNKEAEKQPKKKEEEKQTKKKEEEKQTKKKEEEKQTKKKEEEKHPKENEGKEPEEVKPYKKGEREL